MTIKTIIAMKIHAMVDLADISATKLVWHMSRLSKRMRITNSLAISSQSVPRVRYGRAMPRIPKIKSELKLRKKIWKIKLLFPWVIAALRPMFLTLVHTRSKIEGFASRFTFSSV